MRYLSFIAVSALVLSLPFSGSRADDRTLRGAAYQAGVEQEQMRAQTKRLMVDMTKILEEFRYNPAAAEEVKLTEATIAKLQNLSDTEMAAVVSSMKEAGAAPAEDDAPGKILAANKTAKEIQVTLTRLADKLAVFQDEALVELKLTALLRRQLANQRQTKYLREAIVPDYEKTKEAQLTMLEQKTIKEEVDTLQQTLQQLSANPASTDGSTFAAIYSAGATAQLTASSDSALALVTSQDFTNATAAQTKVVQALQGMLLALNSSKSQEERLRTAEARVRTLANMQKLLGRQSTRSNCSQQPRVKRKQQEIADERTILEQEIIQLNTETAPLLGLAGNTMEKIDTTLERERAFLDNTQNKLSLVGEEEGLSQNFLEIAEMLKKQSDAVAKANSSSQSSSNASNQAALSDAASSILDAMSKMEMAKEMLNQSGGDNGSAQEQMSKAQGDLAKAESRLSAAKDSAPQGAGENLKKAEASLAQGYDQASQAGGDAKSKSDASINQAQELARQTLAELQKSLNAANSPAQKSSGNQAGNQTQSSLNGSGWAEVSQQEIQDTAFSATIKMSEKDRAALSLLQREKSPPEYDTMARQYLKNLAEGVVPLQ